MRNSDLFKKAKHSALLSNPDFLRLTLGCGFNGIGKIGEQVIIGLLVFQLTGSSEWVGVSLALYFGSFALCGMAAGVTADWMDRRVLLFRIEVLILANLAVFAAVVALEWANLWMVLALTFVSGAIRAMHHPVRTSYAYDLLGAQFVVPALGLLNLGARSGQMLGALVTGAALEHFGGAVTLLGLAGMHGVALVWFHFLKTSGASASQVRAPLRESLREYAGELRGNRILLMLVVVTALVEIFGFSFTTALPELAERRFNAGADGLGYLYAARSLGGILASLLLTLMVALKYRGRLYIGVIFGFGLGLILLAEAPFFWMALVALVGVAMMATASDILTQSMVQLSVPNHLRGRAMGAWTLAIGSAPLGHLEMGYLIGAFGLGGALLGNGMVLLVTGVFVLIAIPRLRQL